MGTSSTTPSRPTCRCRCRRSTPSSAAGVPRRRQSPNSRAEFALDVVPTRHYGANCAWQQLSILAYNLARTFQLATIAEPRRCSRKRTYTYVLRSMRTLRFLLITRAGRVTRIGGRNVLRLAQNPATQALYARVEQALAA